MRTLKLITIAALAGFLMVGCCSKCRKARENATRPLQGTVWHLIQMDGKTVDAPDKYEITFFNNGRVGGIGECNRYFGTYEVLNANGGIRMSKMASTMMACLNPNMEYEFMQMLEEVHLYQFDASNLYLFVDGKLKAVFEPTAKPVNEPAE